METVPTVYIVNADVVANSLTRQLLSTINIFSRDFVSPVDLLRQGQFNSPCCFLISFLLPDYSGMELLRRLRKQDVFNPCIFTSTKIEHELIVDAMHSGGFGFIKKPFDANQFIELVQKALEIDSQVQQIIQTGLMYRDNRLKLTARELEILDLILRDYSAMKISELLNISHRTVENHRNRIFSKFNVSKISEMVRIATIYDTLKNTGKLDRYV